MQDGGLSMSQEAAPLLLCGRSHLQLWPLMLEAGALWGHLARLPFLILGERLTISVGTG